MLVDDDFAAHTFHKIMIEEANLGDVIVEEYFSVDAALDHIKSCMCPNTTDILPQVILVDLNLPKKTGWDFVEELKTFDLKEFFPLVYLVTNSENPSDRIRVKETNEIVGFMPKFLESSFFAGLGSTINRKMAS